MYYYNHSRDWDRQGHNPSDLKWSIDFHHSGAIGSYTIFHGHHNDWKPSKLIQDLMTFFGEGIFFGENL